MDLGHSCDLDHRAELLRVSDWGVLPAGREAGVRHDGLADNESVFEAH